MIVVIGDYDQGNPTHVATSEALEALPRGTPFEWVGTDAVPPGLREQGGVGGFLIAPASPYRDMEAVLDVIRLARERGVPLVGT